MSDSVLKEPGVEFLEDASSLYRSKGWSAASSEFDLGLKKDNSPVIALPNYQPGYGELIENDQGYVAKFASFTGPTHIYCYDNGQNTLLSSEEFVEPLAWLEAEERGDEDLFAEVKAWDADFKWIVMEKADAVERDHPLHQEKGNPMLEERGWKPVDLEVGYKNGEMVAIDYGLVEPEEGWSLDESHLLKSDRCHWNRPTVSEKDINYNVEIDQDQLYKFIRRKAPASIAQNRQSQGSKYDAFRAFQMKSCVDKLLDNDQRPQKDSPEFTELIKNGVKDGKTSSILLASMAQYSGLEAEYVEGVKKPKRSDETAKNHAWTSVYFGETEHLIDPELEIIGRYEPMLKGHEYVEKERKQFMPLPASP